MHPNDGKHIANGKGVYREVESEGSWMWGKILTLWANLWSDEQKSHKRSCMRGSLRHKTKPNSYTESYMINVADIWRESDVWYPGRSVRYALKEVTTTQGSAERTEVSRGHSSREVKD